MTSDESNPCRQMSHDAPAPTTAHADGAALPPEVTILIPAFNEEARLGTTLDRVLAHPTLTDAQIVVIDDGSTDGTIHVALDRLRHRVGAHILASPSNKGKGSAIRKGVVVAQGRKVIVLDADFATGLDAIDSMLARLDDTDVVVGARRRSLGDASTEARPRATLPQAFSGSARQLAGLPVSDPQCGFKGFRAEVSQDLFRRSMFDGYSVDVEILLIAEKLGLRIAEIPVLWQADAGSKVRPVRAPLAMAMDLARVRYRHRATGVPVDVERVAA
jgi:dolichyl-phosphate beta-glucosyltransferase